MRTTYYHLPTVDSTNSFARRHAPTLEEGELRVIVADQQTAGYGRLHRAWLTTTGSLMLSFLFFDETRPLFSFSQAISLAISDILSFIHPHIKWPNDLLVNGKKIAGSLTEAVFVGEKRAVIIGVGMNVNVPKEFLDQIPRKTTSLLLETVQQHSIANLQEELVRSFSAYLAMPVSDIQSLWQKKVAWMLEEKTAVQTPKETFEGIISDISLDGTLTLRLRDGSEKIVHSGDLTM